MSRCSSAAVACRSADIAAFSADPAVSLAILVRSTCCWALQACHQAIAAATAEVTAATTAGLSSAAPPLTTVSDGAMYVSSARLGPQCLVSEPGVPVACRPCRPTSRRSGRWLGGCPRRPGQRGGEQARAPRLWTAGAAVDGAVEPGFLLSRSIGRMVLTAGA